MVTLAYARTVCKDFVYSSGYRYFGKSLIRFSSKRNKRIVRCSSDFCCCMRPSRMLMDRFFYLIDAFYANRAFLRTIEAAAVHGYFFYVKRKLFATSLGLPNIWSMLPSSALGVNLLIRNAYIEFERISHRSVYIITYYARMYTLPNVINPITAAVLLLDAPPCTPRRW